MAPTPKPILVDIPVPILTPRLRLRPPMPGDGPELNAAIRESLPELWPWLPFADHAPTPEETEENVRRAYAAWILREDLRLSIFDRASGKLVGSSGLHRINWKVPAFEIGYWVSSAHSGRGYITETTHALTRYCFAALGAKRVELRTNASNAKSIAVIERLGFQLEGRLRNCDGHSAAELVADRDLLVYARLDTDGLPPLEVSWPKHDETITSGARNQPS